MKQLMEVAGLFLPISLALAACGDVGNVAAADAAASGVGNGANLRAAASRPVWVGRNENRRADACTRRMQVRGARAQVRWSPTVAEAADGPVKAMVSGEVLACDVSAAGWTGIVFGGPGQSLADCNLARRIGGPTEYQGPCRTGWVRTADLAGGS